MDPISASALTGSEISSPSTTTAANTTNFNGPSQASSFIVQDNSESDLLKLPNEIKQRIWALAVTAREPITPIQLRSKSNKFLWSKSQQVRNKQTYNVDTIISAVEPLAAVQLSMVCRQVYQEVAGTHLFYQVNHFDFEDREQEDVTTYLVAITEPRRKAMRSISVRWNRWYRSNAPDMFTMIAACQSLQSLDINLVGNLIHLYTETKAVTKFPGFKDCLDAVQGLKNLTVRVSAECIELFPGSKEVCEEAEALLKERMSNPRSAKVNSDKLRKAQLNAKLDIHGEGRLSEDKKPGVVASRTRQQVRNVDKLAADGTLPDRDSPKYDLNGDLAWCISTIEDSREVRVDGSPSVEFLIKGGPSFRTNRWRIQEGKEQKFWEDITTMNSLSCRYEINDFYQKNPKAYGKQVVLDVWKLRNLEDDREDKLKVQSEKRLEAMIRHQALIEQWEAERAAQAARQAAKDLKATKTSKKAKKVNTAAGSH